MFSLRKQNQLKQSHSFKYLSQNKPKRLDFNDSIKFDKHIDMILHNTSFNLWILFVIRIESSLIIFELFFSLAIQDKRDNSLISSDGNNISHVIPSQITTQDQNIISELELNAFKTFRIYNEGVFLLRINYIINM